MGRPPRSDTMGFHIDYGSPGVIGTVMFLLIIGAGIIILMFFFGASKKAHDEVVQDIEDEGGDLKG